MKKALVVIDMQNDFLTGSLGNASCAEVIGAVVEKIKKRRSEGYEILFTRDTHGGDYLSSAEGKKLPVIHCIKNTSGWEICNAVKGCIMDCDEIIDKPTFGSITLAKRLCGYDAAELCGVCSDICVISNAVLIKTITPETQLAVDKSCVAGVTPQSNEAALVTMASLQVDII